MEIIDNNVTKVEKESLNINEGLKKDKLIRNQRCPVPVTTSNAGTQGNQSHGSGNHGLG